MVRKRPSILAVCLAAALVLSGCAGQQLSDEQEQRVGEQFEERMSEIDGYQATITTTVTYENQTHETTADVWTRTDTGEFRQEILAPDERAGNRLVSNGSVMWQYDAADNTATRIDIPDTGNSTNAVPQVERLVERYDIVSNGTVTLDGTETHKLTLVPNESADGPASGTVTLWVDTEKMFPLKMEMEFGETTSTVRYENLTINPEFDDGTFEFDPPDGVTVEEQTTPSVSEYDSRDSLANATEYALPDPDLPEKFTFEQGMVTERNGATTAVLQYSNGTDRVTLQVSDDATTRDEDGETVSLGDREGQYAEFGSYGRVGWTCEETNYSVFGTLEKSTLVDIAASIEC